jgi:hypothetical protein
MVLDAGYWFKLEMAATLCRPIYRLLRIADGDVPSVGKVHYYAAQVRRLSQSYS